MIKIIPMNEENAHYVYEIESVFFKDAWTTDKLIKTLQNNNIKYFIASIDDDICGYVGVMNTIDQLEIINIATLCKYQNRGVGSALLSYIAEYAKELNIPKICLEVRASNENAQHLYEKNFYKLVRVEKNYYHNPKEDANIYEYTWR